MSGAPSTEVMMMSLRPSCLAARSLPIACGSLIVNTASMSAKRVRWPCMTFRPPSRRALAVLVVGQDLDVRVLGQHLLAALDPVDHRRDLRAVLDDRPCRPCRPACRRCTGRRSRRPATLLVCTVASAPAAATSTATTTMPAACARLTAGAIALASAALSRIMSTPEAMKLSIWVNCLLRS